MTLLLLSLLLGCTSDSDTTETDIDTDTVVSTTNGLDSIPVTRMGGFGTDEAWVLQVEFRTALNNGTYQVEVENFGILDGQDVVRPGPILISVLADGVAIPHDENVPLPVPAEIELEITGDGPDDLIRIVFATDLVPQHTITSPMFGDTIREGDTITWEPFDTRMFMQIGGGGTGVDGRFADVDDGEFTLPAIQSPGPTTLWVDRRASFPLDGFERPSYLRIDTSAAVGGLTAE